MSSDGISDGEDENFCDQLINSAILKSAPKTLMDVIGDLRIPVELKDRANFVFQQMDGVSGYRKAGKKQLIAYRCILIAAIELGYLLVPKRLAKLMKLTDKKVSESLKLVCEVKTNYPVPYKRFTINEYVMFFGLEQEWLKCDIETILELYPRLDRGKFQPQVAAAVAVEIFASRFELPLKSNVMEMTGGETKAVLDRCRTWMMKQIPKQDVVPRVEVVFDA